MRRSRDLSGHADRPRGAGAPTVGAHAYAIYDESAGRQLASSRADDRLPVGSLMKLLNAYVAYRAGEPDQVVIAPDGLAGGAHESVIGIGAGQAITRGVLIRAMLKVSANDAARCSRWTSPARRSATSR